MQTIQQTIANSVTFPKFAYHKICGLLYTKLQNLMLGFACKLYSSFLAVNCIPAACIYTYIFRASMK